MENLRNSASSHILLLSLFFGTTIVVSRFAIDLIPSTQFVSIRLIIASLIYLLYFALRKGRRLPKEKLFYYQSAVIGVFGTTIPMLGIITSLNFLSSGISSVLLTTGPAITVVLAHFFLDDEKLNKRIILGVILAFSGSLLLVFRGETGLALDVEFNPIGYLLVFGAMIASSSTTVFIRKKVSDFAADDITGIRLMTAAILVSIIVFATGGFNVSHLSISGWSAILYTAIVGTTLAMLLAFYNIRKFGATTAAMVAYIIPIIASITGYIFLDEIITQTMIGGLSLILLGVWLINKKMRSSGA